MSSPKLFRKISVATKRPFRVAILGQNGVGKSETPVDGYIINGDTMRLLYKKLQGSITLTVRFLTNRFIGDYDPLLENTYSCTKCLDGENIALDILDTAAQEANSRLEANIRWADAYILVYSVADRCSFNECNRQRVLISSYSKRSKRGSHGDHHGHPPIVLVGNQADRSMDRMVSHAEGQGKAREMHCVAFFEISVRESVDSVYDVFEQLYIASKKPRRTLMQNSMQSSSVNGLSEVQASPNLRNRRRALYSIS